MSESRAPIPPSVSLTLEELARLYEATAIDDLESWKLDVWESDEELEESIADVRRSRNAWLA